MSGDNDDIAVDAARLRFRDAVERAHRTRANFTELDAAVASYCQLLRKLDCPPERTLIMVKQVIDDVINDHDRTVAERAVLMCIQQYYRGEARDNSART